MTLIHGNDYYKKALRLTPVTRDEKDREANLNAAKERGTQGVVFVTSRIQSFGNGVAATAPMLLYPGVMA